MHVGKTIQCKVTEIERKRAHHSSKPNPLTVLFLFHNGTFIFGTPINDCLLVYIQAILRFAYVNSNRL